MIARFIDRPRDQYETPGQRIRRLRTARGWTGGDLARQAVLDIQTVYRAEGDHDIYAWTLDALARALGVGMTELWRGEQP